MNRNSLHDHNDHVEQANTDDHSPGKEAGGIPTRHGNQADDEHDEDRSLVEKVDLQSIIPADGSRTGWWTQSRI